MAEKTLNQLYAKDSVAVEMARRKVAFHNDEQWDKINLWGLFRYSQIKKHLKSGKLIADSSYTPRNVTYWVTPSKEYWETSIRPIVEKFTEKELQDTLYY
jgi:hypothetical protein